MNASGPYCVVIYRPKMGCYATNLYNVVNTSIVLRLYGYPGSLKPDSNWKVEVKAA